MSPDWIVPDWPAPDGIRAIITTRAGGVSLGPYAALNVGFSTGDDANAVEENRRRLRMVLPADPRWLKQVHGTQVVDAGTLSDRVEADAAFARDPRTVCAVLIADCLPVLFTDRVGSIVAVAHAGWRGLAGGVIALTLEALRKHSAHDVIAYIGPGIGRDAFEVGEDVYRAFTTSDAGAAEAFVPHRPGKWLADLPALARRALAACGVSAVYGGSFCTFSDPARFFSYRRDGETGRMAALIWREA
jgi:YfiH family protein